MWNFCAMLHVSQPIELPVCDWIEFDLSSKLRLKYCRYVSISLCSAPPLVRARLWSLRSMHSLSFKQYFMLM